jgi:hypothetical protein
MFNHYMPKFCLPDNIYYRTETPNVTKFLTSAHVHVHTSSHHVSVCTYVDYVVALVSKEVHWNVCAYFVPEVAFADYHFILRGYLTFNWIIINSASWSWHLYNFMYSKKNSCCVFAVSCAVSTCNSLKHRLTVTDRTGMLHILCGV